jgi:pimeloyl-ACP methyl ester carboxylesterase
MRQIIKHAFYLAVGIVLTLVFGGDAHGQFICPVTPVTFTGTLADGATFLIEKPGNWNGTLFLYSHGYVVPGSNNPAQDVGDPLTRCFMLLNGFALAGSSYAHAGWAIQEALADQIEVLDMFPTLVGQAPTRTIAWGHSLGGIITAGLIQRNPDRFAGALPMCGVLAGGVATWNAALDSEFAFKTLLGSPALQMVDITSPGVNLAVAELLLGEAQSTPQGRAQLALASALGNGPGWFTPTSPEPAPNDFAGQEMNQFLWSEMVDFPFLFLLRAELEFRAGGNPSFNTGVDYRALFGRSIDRAEVAALYAQAGLDLEGDLDKLQSAARISADPNALQYLEKNIIFNGNITIPVLTMHTKGDGLVVVQNETAYQNVVDKEGNAALLREIFVHRAGHCAFTPAETITAAEALLSRLDTGIWPALGANGLNQEALMLGQLNVAPPAFFEFQPSQYLRPFDALPGE